MRGIAQAVAGVDVVVAHGGSVVVVVVAFTSVIVHGITVVVIGKLTSDGGDRG